MKLLFTILLVGVISGCSMTAPNYSAKVENFSALAQSGNTPIATGEFLANDKKFEKLSLRGSSLLSPNGSYSAYLKSAIKNELTLAKRYKEDAQCTISATVLDNDIDISSFSEGQTVLSADFRVYRDGSEVYKKTLTEKQQFESSFVGAIAIPNGVNSYVPVVQGLIGQLFNDPDFQHAVK